MGDSDVWRSVNMAERTCADPSIWMTENVEIRQYG